MTTHAAPAVPAMLLAAGRGERMRPLTDTCPKPLLPVAGKPLMQWALEALAHGGCQRVLINTAWLGEQISATFGEYFGPQPLPHGRNALSEQEQLPTGMVLEYSHEGRDFGHALETAGGIVRALPTLCPGAAMGQGHDVFWVLAGDVLAPDFAFDATDVQRFVASTALAHIWLVPNPAHHPQGDFGWDPASGLAENLHPTSSAPRYTYSTIGLYRTAFFAPPYCHLPSGNPLGEKAALAPLLRAAMDEGRVSASLYTGRWADVGTPERLAQLNTPA